MFSSDEMRERYADKVEKHIKISKPKAEKIAGYARHFKLSENEVIDKAITFWLENKNLKVERDSSLHLATTASEELCQKCGHVIPKVDLALYNKNLGWVCLECDPTCHGNRALAQKILKNMQLERANNVLEAQLAERTEKLEVIDNKEKVCQLLLQMEQYLKLVHENDAKLESFFKTFAQYSDSEVGDNLQKRSADAKHFHDTLESFSPMLQFLERTASDQIVLTKRRRKRLEASVEDTE